AVTMLAPPSNRQLKLPNNLHRSTDAVSRSRPAWPSANALRQLAFTQAHRPRRSNPHRFSIPRFPPLEVFRRRPPEYRAITVSGRHPKTFTKVDVVQIYIRSRSMAPKRNLWRHRRAITMISFLSGLPLWYSGIVVVGLPMVLAMVGSILVRRYVTLEKLAENNEVAGFKFAVVGVLYAVLLAFAIVVVWERFSNAENNVATEAGAAANIYRLSHGINGQPGMALRGALTNHLRSLISHAS